MLIIKSDFSPYAAQDLQEADNVKALRMLIQLSGLTDLFVTKYEALTEKAASAYSNELSSLDETQDCYDKAKAASKPFLDRAETLLAEHGISICNKLVVSENKDFFSRIETTLCIDYADSTPVARIERAVIDIETESYEDNVFGYQS